MRIRAYVYALVALVAAAPSAALGVVAAVATVSPSADVVAGSVVQVTCRAEGRNPGGMTGGETMQSITVNVSGGAVSPATIPGPTTTTTTCTVNAGSCNVIQGTVAWTTPGDPAALTVSCTANYLGGFTGTTPLTFTGAPVALTTIAGSALPPAVTAVNGPSQVVAGSVSSFEAVATDPNDPPLPLSYSWTATAGTVVPDPANPALASWTAPQAPGAHTLTVTVSNGTTQVSSLKAVSVVLAAYQANLPLPLGAPRRLAADASGALYVVDGQQGQTGSVTLATARGEARGFATLPEPALAVATGGGLVWATTTKGSVFKIDPATGRTLGKLALADGPFASPLGIAWDDASATLWVADKAANQVRVIRPDGSTVATIAAANGAPLVAPVDVAVDAAAGKAWVLVFEAKRTDALGAGEPAEAARFLHSFDLSGRHLASHVTKGGGAGQVTRAGGLALGPAGLYVSDLFQGAVQVVSTAGAPVGTIGAFGDGAGQLMNPMGLAVMANGDLAVASTSTGTVERFGSGAGLPTCAGDADCDGLSDAWELANGLDPDWAGDALLDRDGDGLTNAEELALGTNPNSADTDGDGYSDRDELLAGFDPLDPNDHRPAISATGPAEVPPGLVRLSAVAAGTGTCGVRWAQRGGPAVSLRSGDTAAPSFVARAAGAYDFDAVATCGSATSLPARVRVVVRNVAPNADAGRVTVATPGSAIRLDALASSDANGDALTYTWDQTLGAPVIGAESGGAVTARPRGAGLYAFQVTVADALGAVSTAEVPVLVAAGPAPTAIAAAVPAEAQAGGTVLLDASASLVESGAAFSWSQVSGPAVAISAAGQPVASFVATAPGRYAFEVTAGNGPLRSPPARVEVFVAAPGAGLPAVTAAAPSIVPVGAPVALEATSAAAEVRWRQVSGPAAGLSDGDRPTATAVPFAAGFHVFEVSARDASGAESRPVRVAFEARAGGKAIPVARVAAPAADAWVGQLVFLDGRASTGATRFRWTQVAGPWVAAGAQAAVTSFRPLAPGRYAFELEVDDGTARSAPARVEVNVVAQEGVR